MQAASHGRILHCSIADSVRHSGIGQVTFARQYPTGETAIVHILLDIYCLGVKDIAATVCSPADAQSRIESIKSRGCQNATPGFARGLVEAAIDYAHSLGFSPHSDYRKVAPLWGDTAAESVAGLYEFGKNGKPYYTNGPFDDLARQHFILRTLEQNVGAGNFYTMIGSPMMAGGNVVRVDVSEDDEGVDAEDEGLEDYRDEEIESTADYLLDAQGNVIRRLDVSDD